MLNLFILREKHSIALAGKKVWEEFLGLIYQFPVSQISRPWAWANHSTDTPWKKKKKSLPL